MAPITRIPDIERLQLPNRLPDPRAMVSWKENETSYDPQFWELEYVSHRYVGHVDEHSLRARYDSIVRNMRALVSEDRHVIPMWSFLSSWYWYRKEHLTRLEFACRGLALYRALPALEKRDLSKASARPRGPNSGDVLFRYGEQKWLRKLVDRGQLRVKSAREYALIENGPARKDDELVKHCFSPGEYVTITMPDGRKVRSTSDLRYSISGTDYFVYCVSNDWDPELFADFGGACVVIRDPDEFARRLRAAAPMLDDWYFHYNPVSYFDTHERRGGEYITNTMSKDFRFAYQRETRFLWAGMGKEARGSIDLELGPLGDIATLVTA